MSLENFMIQLLNSVQYGLLLFMLAAGLTLIFGILGVVNLAHGSFYMVGAYLAWWLSRQLGSLTLALLPHVQRVLAVEVDERLAAQLPLTVAAHAPSLAARLDVIHQDAMTITAQNSPFSVEPTALVANLPYNISVPVVLHLLGSFPTIRTVLVMVQKEVADRLVAGPGSRTYGVPSVKARWFGELEYAGNVGRSVFWPAPNVDSGLVRITRMHRADPGVSQREVFAIVDAAFSQRRKMLRSALASLLGSSEQAEQVLMSAGIDPSVRGEQLDLEAFIAIARASAARAA